MASPPELRRVARFKGIPEFTCERCGQSFPNNEAGKLEIVSVQWRPLPEVRCRSYQACERRQAARA